MKEAPRYSQVIVLLILVFLTRLPFLDNGYGAEEDSWALAVNAKVMHETQAYEASRLPGHPLQEYAYSLMWDAGPWAYNFLTALLSTAGVGMFILLLMKLNAAFPLLAGAALAMTPVVYINSTNNMDYLWALSFLMGSFYLVVSGKFWLAGILLGMAVGCRITSLLLLPAFLYYAWSMEGSNRIRACMTLIVSASVTSFLLFLPVIQVYGPGFFTATDYFPYPPLAKVIYKGTIGVFGVLGLAAVCVLPFLLFKGTKHRNEIGSGDCRRKILIRTSLIVVMLTGTAYVLKPEKSAYVIPAIPFIVLLISLLKNKKSVITLCILMIASPFAGGINLKDELRGDTGSSLSASMKIEGQQVSFDLLRGPVMADYFKRKNRLAFSSRVAREIQALDRKSLIIAGWWYNELLMQLPATKNPAAELRFYVPEDELLKYSMQGAQIYFMPEQNKWNDLRYKGTFTDRYAVPWP